MDNTIAALTACMEYPELIPVDALVDAADGFAMLGSIDPLAYLQSHVRRSTTLPPPVYLVIHLECICVLWEQGYDCGTRGCREVACHVQGVRSCQCDSQA